MVWLVCWLVWWEFCSSTNLGVICTSRMFLLWDPSPCGSGRPLLASYDTGIIKKIMSFFSPHGARAFGTPIKMFLFYFLCFSNLVFYLFIYPGVWAVFGVRVEENFW